MGATFIIPTQFTAIDKFSSPVKGMSRNLLQFAEKAEVTVARGERSFRKLTPVLGQASKDLLSMASTAALAGGIIAGGSFSVKALMDYETALKSLQAVTGVSDKTMVEFKSQIIDVAKHTKMSAIDVTKSFETIGSMMSQYLDDPKALRQITDAGITLSKAARMDLEPTLMSLTSVMNQFGLKAAEADDTIQKLTAGEIVGSVRTSQIAEYLQEFGAGAKQANINVGESVALIEALGIQLKQDKIGVGARNILTVLDAAKGLDKQALKSLRKNGVDAAFLMDKTKPLGARLRELSKIQNDAIAVVNVFGKENKTAANVIFNQLGTYDKFYEKIQTTKEAQNQAALNSDTLSEKLVQLKNSWITMLAGSDKATSGLNMAKTVIGFVTEHMELIVSVGTKILLFFAGWKTLLMASRAALVAYNVVQGITNALNMESVVNMNKNVIAQKAYFMTTKALTGALWLMDAAMAASPLALVAVGVIALAGAYALLQSTTESQTEREERLRAGVINSAQEETDAIRLLSKAYEEQGKSKEAAMRAASIHEQQNLMLDLAREQYMLKTGTDVEKENAVSNIQAIAERFSAIKAADGTGATADKPQILNSRQVEWDFNKKTQMEKQKPIDANIKITVNDPNNHLTIDNDGNSGIKITTTSTMPSLPTVQ